MEKEPFIVRMTKWSWTPIILGAVVSFLSVAVLAEGMAEAIPGGVGFVLFAWIAMIKGFSN